jgi:hypothetical protein
VVLSPNVLGTGYNLVKAEFYLDGTVLLATDGVPPFAYGWNTASVPDGVHTLNVKGYDIGGAVDFSKPVTVTVDNAHAGPNLLLNPEAKGSDNLIMVRNAQMDPSMTRQPGSGAIDLSAVSSQVQSELIAVVPGKTYVFSLYMRTDVWPTHGNMFVGVYDSEFRFRANFQGSYQGGTLPDAWQECAIMFTPQPGDAYVRVIAERVNEARSPRTDGHVWVDDLYFAEGDRFREAASAKKVFEGSKVRIDALGNYEIFVNNAWKPFFPFAIYQDVNRPSYQLYSNQGFNCILFNQMSPDIVNKAKTATSAFNPDGMRSVAEIVQYIRPDLSPALYNTLADLRTRVTALKQSSASSHLLAYYWDQEAYNQYDVAKSVTDVIKEVDRDASGRPNRPISMHAGNQGLGREYDALADSIGDFSADEGTLLRRQSSAQRFGVLDRIEGQTNPLGFGIISRTASASGVRQEVYQLLIAGMKGIGYYRDGTTDGQTPIPSDDITTRECWAEFPRLRQEIDQLLPLIRQPKETAWNVTPSSTDILFGKRDYQNEGYLFLVNKSPNAATVSFRVSGLSYAPQSVADYFTGSGIGSVQNGSFSLSFAPYQTKVVRLSH